MDTKKDHLSTREVTIRSLAVIGFITLTFLGAWLAIYSARYVPKTVSRAATAAVYISSIFTPTSSHSSLSVVPVGATTTPDETTAPIATTPPVPVATKTTPKKKPVALTSGKRVTTVRQIKNNTSTLYGLPDLTVSIDAVGYLASTSVESFIATSTIPHGKTPAVMFTIKNSGTNIAGSWRFSASIPTKTAYTYQSPVQNKPRKPGDSVVFTLGFTRASAGADKIISITVNPDHTVTESNTNNNTASTKITILGS